MDEIDCYNISNDPTIIPLFDVPSLSDDQKSFISLLEKNPDKIYWEYLSTNPAAIPLLEKNPDKIKWRVFSKNPVKCKK